MINTRCCAIGGSGDAMKIIKRNGSEAVFDISKIITAIGRANKTVPESERMTQEQIVSASHAAIEADCVHMNRAPSVEEIQEMVETAIMGDRRIRGREAVHPLSVYALARAPFEYHGQSHSQPDRMQQRGGQAGERQQEPRRSIPSSATIWRARSARTLPAACCCRRRS